MKLASRLSIFAAAAILPFLFLTSCAEKLAIENSADPLGALDDGGLAYLRMSGMVARELAPDILSPEALKLSASTLERSRVLAVVLTAPGAALPATDQAPDSPALGMEAVLIGDYPSFAVNFSLSTGQDWSSEGKGVFRHKKLGFHASAPASDVIAVWTDKSARLPDSVRSPSASPIPPSLSALASEDLVLWAPKPFAGLFSRALGTSLDLPVQGFLVSAERDRKQEAGRTYYLVTVAFSMSDPEAARIYRPAVKLAWLGISSALAASSQEPRAAADFKLNGSDFIASGLSLSSGDLSRLVRALGLPSLTLPAPGLPAPIPRDR